MLSIWSVSGRDPEDHLLRRAVDAAIRRQKGLNHSPGTRYSYSNTNYYLLARLVEAVDGRSFRDFLAEELFGPLGMQASGVLDDHGRIVAQMAESYARAEAGEEASDGELRRRLYRTDLVGASAAYSTVLDMARWNAFLAGASDRRVGSPEFVDSLFATIRLDGSGEPNVYAFGLRNMRRRGVHEIGHGGTWGGFRTYFRHYPDSGLGVTVLCNQLEISPFQLSARVADLYLGDLVSGPEPAYRPPGSDHDAGPDRRTEYESVAPYLGRYYSPELDADHTFTYEDGALWVQAGWQEPVPLARRDERQFAHGGTTWTFLEREGLVTGVRMDSGRVRGVEFERRSGASRPSETSRVIPESVRAIGGDPATLGFPSGLAFLPDGDVLVADRRANRVFVVDLEAGTLRPFAGTGEAGFAGDGGPALEARLQHPDWVALAADGDVLIADTRNHRVRRVDRHTGTITTIAGTGENRASGDGGPAVSASLTNPYGLAVDPSGHIYVFDTEAHSIRRIDADTGLIETVVGTGEAGFGGDGGPGREASLRRPHNGFFASDGSLVFGDSFNQRIRRWDPATDRIETIAGAGVEGTSPAGTPAGEASFTYFGSLLEEPDGSLVYTGLEGRLVRIRASDARLEVLATGLEIPYGVLRLPDGDFLVADAGRGRLVRIPADEGDIRPFDLRVAP